MEKGAMSDQDSQGKKVIDTICVNIRKKVRRFSQISADLSKYAWKIRDNPWTIFIKLTPMAQSTGVQVRVVCLVRG